MSAISTIDRSIDRSISSTFYARSFFFLSNHTKVSLSLSFCNPKEFSWKDYEDEYLIGFYNRLGTFDLPYIYIYTYVFFLIVSLSTSTNVIIAIECFVDKRHGKKYQERYRQS